MDGHHLLLSELKQQQQPPPILALFVTPFFPSFTFLYMVLDITQRRLNLFTAIAQK